MKIESINYHKVFNLGNYQNEKIGVSIAINEGDDPVTCHFKAVQFVEKAHAFQHAQGDYKRALEIASNPMKHTGYDVERAKTCINDFETNFAEHLTAFHAMNLKAIPEESNESDTFF